MSFGRLFSKNFLKSSYFSSLGGSVESFLNSRRQILISVRSTMSKSDMKTKLVNLLNVIFQFEDQDLDFGIYRIMNQKREDIRKFIDQKLINKINEQLRLIGEQKKKKKLQELQKLKSRIIEAYTEGAFKDGELKDEFKDYPLGRKYTEKLQQLKAIEVSEDLERDIYNHIYSFFSRYYDKGDFVSKRRVGRQEKYAIPYSGQETLLHWTNKDQYYVKTTLQFKKYTFMVNGLTVNFRVVQAEEEKGNLKAENRYFVIHEKKPFELDGNVLNIYFEYRPLSEKEQEKRKFGKKTQISQQDVNRFNFNILQRKLGEKKKTKALFKKENNRTVLNKNLYKFTTSNRSDYFIHKNLKEFLTRELDFYVKNEVLGLEDIKQLGKEDLDRYLLEAKVTHNISMKIIEFLSQIENLQKKLWEKKKFVVKTDYVITLGKIKGYAGETFLKSVLDRIMKNEGQMKEWKELLGVKVKSGEDLLEDLARKEGSKYNTLPIDTRYFDEKFKLKLLEAITDEHNLDDILNGLLIKSENFHALNLISQKYRERVKCIYIDPPYNTGSDEFIYKDNYQHSSWLSMVYDRLVLGRELLRENGVIHVSIDDNEVHNLRTIMDEFFGTNNRLGTLVWDLGTGTTAGHFTRSHEYVLSYAKQKTGLPNFYDPRGGKIRHGALKIPSRKNPISPITFPVGIDFEGEDAVFEGEIGGTEKMIIEGQMVFENGKLKHPVTIKAAWAMKKQLLSWLQGKETFDSKGQKVLRFFFNSRGILFYEKERRTVNPKTVLSKFGSTKQGTDRIENIFGERVYNFPKSVELISFLVGLPTGPNDFILDFFAGSGTTADAVMEMNKQDGGHRKFILVDLADFFETITLARVKKVAYSFDWKKGKVQSVNGPGGFFKYHYLEQYEDALENIQFEQRTVEEFGDYFVKYMLDFETRNSSTLLNIDEMQEPFNYKIKILETLGKPPKQVNVDLVETFNYLIGLDVDKVKVVEENKRKYLFVLGKVGDVRTLVVWRSLKDIDFEEDKRVIERIRKELAPDQVYVNGDAGIRNFKQIEKEFKSLLWE